MARKTRRSARQPEETPAERGAAPGGEPTPGLEEGVEHETTAGEPREIDAGEEAYDEEVSTVTAESPEDEDGFAISDEELVDEETEETEEDPRDRRRSA